ncbi:hypothetical protein [Klebsiella michiganensis]|uniref:hypothetical protein n=1 Tax=Klebsiella michiganensis TaxID=1134687 RepID=UPI002451C9AF|nr:hypothetical protein [Klebsiella michiganensis]
MTGEVVALASNAVTITAGGVSRITAVAPASATCRRELYGSDFVANEYRAAADAGEFPANLSVATAVDVAVTDSVGYESAIISGNVLQTDAGGDVGDTGTDITVTSIVATSVPGQRRNR